MIKGHSVLTKLANGTDLSQRMVLWSLKLIGYNENTEHRARNNNVNADAASNKSLKYIEMDDEVKPFSSMYRHLEDPKGIGSLNTAIFEKKNYLSRLNWVAIL